MNPFVAFDLGNVLLPFDHMKPCRLLGALHGFAPELVSAHIFDEGLEARFESGALNPNEFMDACEAVLGVHLDRAVFPEVWSDIFQPDDRMARLVADLRPLTNLCLVSNTNPWHFSHVQRHFPVVSAFEHRVLSFEIGCLKPDERIFHIAKSFASDNTALIYVDDLAVNVRAAAGVGFRAIHFRNEVSLRQELIYCGVEGLHAACVDSRRDR